MKLALSNIAWQPEHDDTVVEIMQESGITGVEIAPTKIWPRPLEVTESEALRYRAHWESRGIAIVALQSLVFGRPDLEVFGTDAKRNEFIEYLTGIMRLGRWLGAGPHIFGSPKNRKRGAKDRETAHAIAAPFFAELGRRAEDMGVFLCIEPNPEVYDCDFVTTADDTISLCYDGTNWYETARAVN